MLLIGLISLLIAIPLYSSTISPTLLTRMTTIILLFSAALSFNRLYVQAIGSGLGLYSGLFHVTTVTQRMEVFLYTVGALILLPWASENNTTNMETFPSSLSPIGKDKDSTRTPSIAEYPLVIIFTTIGASFLISSADLVSMYLSIELQSFAVYILAAIYRNSESATSAGLKYFLLGALSSALILLGSSLIYAYTGLTNLERISTFSSVGGQSLDQSISPFYPNQREVQGLLSSDIRSDISMGVVLGGLIIGVGFLFKVAAAPFHNWAPDVYDGVPTIVTTWLTVMPKISIFVFLLEFTLIFSAPLSSPLALLGVGGGIERKGLLTAGLGDGAVNVWKNLLLTTSLLSLVIGTVVGLAQYRLKRLLSYSTISHVGFLLLALSVNSEESMTSFLFYLIQYSITNMDAFFVVLAFGYLLSPSQTLDGVSKMKRSGTDVRFISQLKGQFQANPVLGLSLAFCLFSMAGIPPLVGFFAKYRVLYSAIENGYHFLALVGILASVVSAAYYLRIIRVIHFDSITSPFSLDHLKPWSHSSEKRGTIRKNDEKKNQPSISTHSSASPIYGDRGRRLVLSSSHSYVISVLTLFVVLFILSPSLVLNSSNLLALSLFTA